MLVSYIHLALGDKDRALTLIEKAFDQREWAVGLLKVAPDLDPVRGDPRFAILLKKLNLDR
jgi:hypothetical protein